MLHELHQALDGKIEWILMLCVPGIAGQFVLSHMIEARVVMGRDDQSSAEVLPRLLLIILSVTCLLIAAAGILYAVAEAVMQASLPRRYTMKIAMGSLGVIALTFIFGIGPGSGLWMKRSPPWPQRGRGL